MSYKYLETCEETRALPHDLYEAVINLVLVTVIMPLLDSTRLTCSSVTSYLRFGPKWGSHCHIGSKWNKSGTFYIRCSTFLLAIWDQSVPVFSQT